MNDSNCLSRENKLIEEITAEGLDVQHRLDNLLLLVYVTLLILSVITTWTFKQRRFLFIHESGLSVFYGFIVGIALKYGLNHSNATVRHYYFPRTPNSTCGSVLPPEKIIMSLPLFSGSGNLNLSMSFAYVFEGDFTESVSFRHKATFDPEVFFNMLLPMIIFSAAYSTKRRPFFRNIGAILTYAFIGTFVSTFVMGSICYAVWRSVSGNPPLSFADCLLFGAMVSATDPVTVLAIFSDLHVDVDLYALVFGESGLNDAIAIALSQAVERYGSLSRDVFNWDAFTSSFLNFVFTFGGSLLIGILIAMLTSLLTKLTHIRDYPLLETSLFVLMSYSTFLLAETVGFTGVVSVLFCGIVQAHYTYKNLSDSSKRWTKEFFQLLNFLAENFIFACIGVSTLTSRQHFWNVGFVFLSLFACATARVLSIYPLSALINMFRGYRPDCSFIFCRRSSQNVALKDVSENSSTSDLNAAVNFGYTQYTKNAQDLVSASKRERRWEFPNRITFNTQHVLVFSGLWGAMAFCLTIRNISSTPRQLFFSTTIVIVLVTVFLCGGLMQALIRWLKIPTHIRDDADVDKDDSWLREEMSFLTRLWLAFDNLGLQPLLTHSTPPLTETLPACCNCFSRILTSSEQHSSWLRGKQASAGPSQYAGDSNPTPSNSTIEVVLEPNETKSEHSKPAWDTTWIN